MQGGWAVREDWAAANLASFSNGFEKLKNVGEHITEQSKKAQSILAPMIEDAFELREKTEAQRELERWSAEQEQGRAPKPQVAAAKPRRFSGVVAASPGERSPGSAATPAAPATEHAALPPTSAHSTPGVSLLPATVSAEAKPKALQETAAKAPSALQTPAGSEAPPAAEDEGRTQVRADAAQPEEATMQDKVILQQRVQLEQLRRDKAAAEAEQERLRTEVAMLQRSSSSKAASTHSQSGPPEKEAHANCNGLDSTLRPFLPKGLRSLRAPGAVGQRRSIAMVVLLVGTLALMFRMFTRVDAENLPDTEWDLEIDHSEMQRLVAALTRDKASVAVGGTPSSGGGNSSSALDRDLATVKTILNDLHRKSMKGHGHAAPQLLQDNKRLEQELRHLRAEIATYALNPEPYPLPPWP
jgi:hypothetical protein